MNDITFIPTHEAKEVNVAGMSLDEIAKVGSPKVAADIMDEIADLAADALVGAGIVDPDRFDMAKGIIEEEIRVRLIMHGLA